MKKVLGGYLLDMSKLIFAGVVLSNIFDPDEKDLSIIVGLLAVIVTLWTGLYLSTKT